MTRIASPRPQSWAIGLMTGTVLDGNIDIALIRTDGETVSEFGAWRLAPYPHGLQSLLRETLAAAADWAFTGPEPAIFREAEEAVTMAQTQAVADFLAEEGLAASDISAIGFHGQTVLHRAPVPGRHGETRQLGDGRVMADRLGITVVNDFRSRDMRLGGQGAPLSAIYHQGLLASIDAGPETAVLNLGGVANITWVDETGTPHAFDTGPANAPLNDWIHAHGRGEMDRDGLIAARGTVDRQRLGQLLDHPYLSAPYPKSLDRNSFTARMADGLGLEDGAATLTAFTGGAVGKALDRLPRRPRRLIVCGGGRRNPGMLEAIAREAGVEATSAETVGWRGDAIEAECFAFLARRTLEGLPIGFPLTTGVPEPATGGEIHHPAAASAARS
ncbi:MAG: anhydro-N-acetylmuramic acid kinase [Stappia sp.]|uniref:anhydro-N-acetylmuramic acid kinase n=1 Tax=Stappia sp. TaxID=1870903 RepID=UPI000C5582F9|nr:anhydro-N-acetylmuramic acid kinase [Stappia sp.]MAA99076.1 anhydro-N-acetylmuramic acid kinase [Stappia sp.]MBM18637.1 anhydro-N-acetylmuramic acid kinase [Stappia sp.]MBM22114.1 anhydro-N-acetylmuramic acid kinase [Stappia sp.]